MRHRKQGRKFGRKCGDRKAFIRILAGNLIRHGSIQTTEARARELRMFVERYISYGKKQNLAGLRLLMEKLPKRAAYIVYHTLAPRYGDRRGGYTRIIKQAKTRKQDSARMARIEFV